MTIPNISDFKYTRDNLIKLLKQNSRKEFNTFDLDYLVKTSANHSVRVKGNKSDFIKSLRANYHSLDVIDNVIVDNDNNVIIVG